MANSAVARSGRSMRPRVRVTGDSMCCNLAGPLMRPPLAQAMDAIVKQLFQAAPAQVWAAG
jgi:hypothetical protein